MFKRYRRRELAATALGCAAFAGGVIYCSDDVRQVGIVLLTAAVVRVVMAPAFRSTTELFEKAHEQGFNEGWHEGHRHGRPVVVPLHDDYAGDHRSSASMTR